ncbi:molecular chaperone [Pseudomonas sp. TWR3-1-1]|uniref:molecular chaperone n=1 Tax=Pseudomonas sp. TWR3-1-1 TaxID=2804633 RepID=UPI003CF1003B
MKAVYTAVALWGLSLGAMAGPNINVGLVYDYLDSDKRTYLKRVFNGGTSTAFVRVQVMEMRLKTDGTFEETPLKTQANHSTRDGLMASPARLIVPANGTQGTRLLFMGERDIERYFRVRFVPVVPEKEDEFAQSEEDSDAYKKTLSAGINVLAGYGTVFFVRPRQARFDTRIENTGNRYTLRNDGNTVVVVDEFKDCASDAPLDCKPTTKTHVLPGKAYGFDKLAGRLYRLTLVEGHEQKTIEVKG